MKAYRQMSIFCAVALTALLFFINPGTSLGLGPIDCDLSSKIISSVKIANQDLHELERVNTVALDLDDSAVEVFAGQSGLHPYDVVFDENSASIPLSDSDIIPDGSAVSSRLSDSDIIVEARVSARPRRAKDASNKIEEHFIPAQTFHHQREDGSVLVIDVPKMTRVSFVDANVTTVEMAKEAVEKLAKERGKKIKLVPWIVDGKQVKGGLREIWKDEYTGTIYKFNLDQEIKDAKLLSPEEIKKRKNAKITHELKMNQREIIATAIFNDRYRNSAQNIGVDIQAIPHGYEYASAGCSTQDPVKGISLEEYRQKKLTEDPATYHRDINPALEALKDDLSIGNVRMAGIIYENYGGAHLTKGIGNSAMIKMGGIESRKTLYDLASDFENRMGTGPVTSQLVQDFFNNYKITEKLSSDDINEIIATIKKYKGLDQKVKDAFRQIDISSHEIELLSLKIEPAVKSTLKIKEGLTNKIAEGQKLRSTLEEMKARPKRPSPDEIKVLEEAIKKNEKAVDSANKEIMAKVAEIKLWDEERQRLETLIEKAQQAYASHPDYSLVGQLLDEFGQRIVPHVPRNIRERRFVERMAREGYLANFDTGLIHFDTPTGSPRDLNNCLVTGERQIQGRTVPIIRCYDIH